MGDKITLKIDTREVRGKKVSKLRAQGLTPGVVYGQGIEAMPVQAESGEVRKVVAAAGKHTPVMLSGVKRRIAMIKDVSYDPTRHGYIRHISFHAVNVNEPVVAEVPIHLIGEGESAAEKSGLIVLQSLDKIQVKALPMDLPDAIEISIINLTQIGDRVTLADATLEKGVEFVEHRDSRSDEELDENEERPSVTDLVVASVYEPGALAAANDAAAGDAEAIAEVPADQGSDETQPVSNEEAS
ncbi:50S ribosomal protein L25 [Candidatus Saccharibacteria bacterium]|nr:50S ribosomal protein L25 [Candidatus Saccharibacteria bacterium]